ncbi:S-phase kinase-associated protein 2 [Scaptodrosophila lebanonensis]|uniref:S-phase kinase-associated protein 2 n=1 Tax=Drosophila lebanonensis TaxID=7225 RepID=A0A6J2T641_DROLE|nr:S-phase kinase-associated protein 2 [Scaptodrosophila lebanonensis]
MSSRKHRTDENIENLCPTTRKRCSSRNSAVIGTVGTSASKTSRYEHPSSPSALTFEALEELGIGMLDSEESSSSALSAIALAVSATSDENSNELTPHVNATRMSHQQQRLSLNTTADTTLDSSVNTNNNTVVEVFSEDAQQRLLRQSAEKLHALSQAKRVALGSECSSNSNSPTKRTRNPLATVTCNNQSEPVATAFAPSPSIQHQQQQQPPLSLQPSTSKQALQRQQSRQQTQKPQSQPQTSRMEPSDNFFIYRTTAMSAHLNSGVNYFDKLSDEIVLNIFKWLPKKTLLRLATVCRRFYCLARDETLWTRMDLGLRTLCPHALEQVVRRGVVVLRLAQADIQEPAFTCPPSPPSFNTRLQYLDLSLASISLNSLHILLAHCRQLKKLSLEHAELNDEICFEIAQNKSLEALNLSMSTGLNAKSVGMLMESLTNLSSLNISWTNLSADAITALVVHITPNVIRLNVAGCRRVLFDNHVVILQKRCPQLLELDLSDCNSLTPCALKAIMKFKMLEYLSVSRCYLIPVNNFIELNAMPSLTYLDIFGVLTESAMEVLEKQMPKMGINKFIHSSVARPTVGTRRTSIWGLRTRD